MGCRYCWYLNFHFYNFFNNIYERKVGGFFYHEVKSIYKNKKLKCKVEVKKKSKEKKTTMAMALKCLTLKIYETILQNRECLSIILKNMLMYIEKSLHFYLSFKYGLHKNIL